MITIDSTALWWFAIVAATALVLYFLIRSARPVTPEATLAAIADVGNEAKQLYDVALAGAQMVEQLRKDGEITDNDQAFERAVDYVRRFYPGFSEEDEAKVRETVKAAVFMVNVLGAQIPKVQITDSIATPN